MPGPGHKGPQGPKPKIKNPGKLFLRVMGYVFKNYSIHCIIVVICIIVSVLATVQGTMFTQRLIDNYIEHHRRSLLCAIDNFVRLRGDDVVFKLIESEKSIEIVSVSEIAIKHSYQRCIVN